jgi:spermidine synthase
LLPLLLILFRPLFSVVYNELFHSFLLYNSITFVGCALLLLIPVICMGATLPVLCRFYVSQLTHIGTNTGRLYGLNTFGAAVGSFLTGFWLISQFGVWGTLAIAIVLNTGIGIVCLAAAKKFAGVFVRTPIAETSAPANHEMAPGEYPSRVLYGSLVLFAVSGFCAMSCEVIWTKMLGLLAGPTTYSFTIVLVTFIFGLALGAILFGRLADRTGRPAWLLAITQIGAAGTALLASQLMGNSQIFLGKLLMTLQDNFTLLSMAKFVFLFLAMIVPTICFGATFPTVSKIFTRSAARVGHSIGLAYSINTIGAVVGSFVAGFLLIPLLGKADGLSLVFGIQLLAALIFVALTYRIENVTVRRWAPGLAVGIIALVACLWLPSWNRDRTAIGLYQRFKAAAINLEEIGWLEALFMDRTKVRSTINYEVIYYGDGVAGTSTVLRWEDIVGNESLSMTNSGKPDASNTGDMPTQVMSAHIPLLIHPNAKKIMVLGLASGITAGEVLNYPVEQLDVIEISREVVVGSDFFRPWNHDVLDDRRTNLIIQDGRAHLTLTSEKYDAIISEPSNPWMAGLAALFTHEFFSTARDRLNEGGIFVQFIHSYQMDWPTFALVGRTFADVFPSSLLVSVVPWSVGQDFLLVGFKGNVDLDIAHVRSNLHFAQRSSNMHLADERLIYSFLMTEDLSSLCGEGPINTDSHPRLEFTAPKLMHVSDPAISEHIVQRSRFSPSVESIRTELQKDGDAKLALLDYLLSVHIPFHLVTHSIEIINNLSPAQRDRARSALTSYCHEFLPPTNVIKGDSSYFWCLSAEIERLLAEAPKLADQQIALTRAIRFSQEIRRYDLLALAYQQWLSIDPDNVDVYTNLAQAYFLQQQFDSASNYFAKAIVMRPSDPVIRYNYGISQAQSGKIDSAIVQFLEAVRLQPDFVEAHSKLGVAYVSQKRIQEGVAHLEEALRLNPDYQEAKGVLELVRSEQPR